MRMPVHGWRLFSKRPLVHFLLGVCVAGGLSLGAPQTQPAHEWDAKVFAYTRPAKLVVEESTPNVAQIGFFSRPPQAAASAPDPKAGPPAQPAAIGAMNVIHLRFKDATGDIVPALLCTPRNKKGPFPLVIATHGLTSNKAQVCGQVGPTLGEKGFAVLAADLPCHGERPGEPYEMVGAGKQDAAASDKGDARSNKGMIGQSTSDLWRKAVIDLHQLIDLSEQRDEIDHKAPITLVGYSLGSWISSIAGPSDPRVKEMVLMVGGAYAVPPQLETAPQLIAMDPRRALPSFAGRPLLLLNGRDDRLVNPELAKNLFEAAAEPKKQIWYDSGHLLPAQAYQDAADWIAEQVKK